MSRIPKVYCAECRGKRLYHSERDAREALGRVMVGNWEGTLGADSYALSVYPCPRRRGFHIGRNRRTIKAVTAWMKRGQPCAGSSESPPTS